MPDVGEQRALVADLRARARLRVTQRVANDLAQLEQIRSRPALREPERIIRDRAQEVFLQVARGRDVLDRAVRVAESRTAELRASLRAPLPAATLSRGYAIAQAEDGRVLREAADAPAGARVVVTVERGSIAAVSHGTVDQGIPTPAPPEGSAPAPAPPGRKNRMTR